MTPDILAALVSPALALAGGAAASIPILIHLLSKRRYRQVRWAAMEFLLEAERRNRRRVRVEELILLGLRCLAMFLIGLLLARWFMRPEAMAAVLGSGARTDRIVILDDSYSMTAAREDRAGVDAAPGALGGNLSGRRAAGGPVLFDSARASLLRLLTWLKQETPNDAVTILLTSRPDQPIRTEPTVGHMDLAGFEAELSAIAPSSRGARFPVVFDAVRNMLEARKGSLSAAVYVISDFQQIDWTRSRSSDGPDEANTAVQTSRRSPASALSGWQGKDRTLRILLMDVGRDQVQNLTVTGIEAQSGAGAQAIATVSSGYLVRIANLGERESAPTTLQMYVGDAGQPPAAVPAVAPGATVEVPIEVTFPSEGHETLTVELAPDDLSVDNSRSIVVPVERALRVLVVNGEPSSDPYQDEAFLLNVALRPEGPQFSGNDLTIVDENDFEASELSAYHLVILANVYRVTEELAVRLEQFVSRGGGLAIFLGDQVDPDLYNRILYRDGKGLLPGRLGELMTAASGTNGVPLGGVNIGHPAMRRFRDPLVPYYEGVVAYRYVACEPASVRPTATRNGVPAPAAIDGRGLGAHAASQPADMGPRPPAQVLLRYEDDGKLPALLERTMGSGRVMLATTTVDKEWTNLPERPVYIMLLMELASYLARPAVTGGDHLVGELIEQPLDPLRFHHSALLRLPSFPEEPALRVEALPSGEGGSPVLRWTRTDEPGLYRFVLSETAGGEQVRPAAVNVDSAEGDLRHAAGSELLASMTGLPVEYVSGQALTQQQDTQVRRELWATVLLTLIIVLLIEQALAWWFGGGRRLSSVLPRRLARAAS